MIAKRRKEGEVRYGAEPLPSERASSKMSLAVIAESIEVGEAKVEGRCSRMWSESATANELAHPRARMRDGLVADSSEPVRWSEAGDIKRRERRKGLTEKNQVCAQISPSNAIVD